MTDRVGYPPKVDVVGTSISMTSYDEVAEALRRHRSDRACIVAVCNVHSVMSARRDSTLRQALDHADIATPDGMPLVWAIRRLHGASQDRVYGPTLMRRVLSDREDGLTHFLYGSSPSTVALLVKAIESQYPEALVAGSIAPPFRPLTEGEIEGHLDEIRASGADVVWVGLGMPKQEIWMHRAAGALPGSTLIGVGAAFDFLAGTISQAPDWIQRCGLEWLYRLLQEPKRLWRRYAWNNPSFLVLLAIQILRSRRTVERTTA